MRFALLLAVLLLAVAASACAQPPDTPKPDAVPDARRQRADSVIERAPVERRADPDTLVVTVSERRLYAGRTPVRLVVHTAGTAGVNLLNLHDDEDTSVEAALDVVRRRGGRVAELAHSGARNLAFEAGGRAYAADPNRMFTDAGRRRTLASLSAADPAALDALAALADGVLAAYTSVPTPVVVTLHNNTPGGYSARSYEAGGEYAVDAAAVTVRPGSDPDDFFFVTDRPLYDALVGRGFNAVLQDNDAATDDGSLSVWAAREGVPYVNVEAAHGHRAEQARMVDALLTVLAERQ